MSGETPAGHLARLKAQYQGWTIWKGDQTGDWWASPPPGHPHQSLISAADLDALEVKLTQAES